MISKRNQSKKKAIPEKFKAGFLSTLDGRTELARALRDNYQNIVNDIGGKEDIGHVKSALIERFVWLEATLQTIEQDMATGAVERGESVGRWIQAVNSLTGLAKVLGIERRVPKPCIDLKAYVNSNGKTETTT